MCGKLECILPRRAGKHSETVTRRSAMPEEAGNIWKQTFQGKDRGGCSRSPLAPSTRHRQNGAFSLRIHQRALLLVHKCIYPFTNSRTWPSFFLTELRVPQQRGRRGRLTVFPVGDALMFSPGGETVFAHAFPASPPSFSSLNHLQSHRARLLAAFISRHQSCYRFSFYV